ncbi:MAG: DUF3391 domain-containing protein [Rubrivivax sp.]|jgi:HD-GYP domain-containing protein (c-di-GMP phosphodiesterase class II)|nr:DUF3391 domain-containing protein [Rubrivivax sp.]
MSRDTTAHHPTVAVDALRVGMYVHLDLGWMSHPFPRSSFRIASADQIATIRTLGLSRLRWVPEKSDLHDAGGLGDWGAGPVPTDATGAASENPAQAAARERREQLERQRAATQQCERQYAEAARAWRAAHEQIAARPEQARRDSEALAQGLLSKLDESGDVCVRLLATQAGDRATAHALNVAVISLLMGRTLGMGAQDMLDLGLGALLHDAGKIDLAERLRHPDDHFSSAERAGYQEHVAAGVAHGRRMGLSPGALLVIAQHHENADGSGFPMRLGVDRMSLGARIVSIVNRYDNLCNPPVLARALTPHEAISTLFAQNRDKFDATVLSSFIRMMGVYPAGSLVQLTDDRYAMVVGVNSSRPLKPRVLVHDPAVARGDALFLNLEETPDLGIRRSLPPARLPAAALEYLAPRPRVSYFFEAAPPGAGVAAGAAAQGVAA